MDKTLTSNVNGCLIIGDHPIRKSIESQAKAMSGNDCMVVLTSPATENAIEEDNSAIDLLTSMAKARTAEASRRTVHLLLQSNTSLRIYQSMDFPKEINDAFDIIPFTMEDMWAKNVLAQLPGIRNTEYPPLDRKGITQDSRSTVHVVISGFSKQAEAIALHAALMAHYPNYHPDDKMPLRSRVTIIDKDMAVKKDSFIAKYQTLFEHSYYRTINLYTHTQNLHRPMYEGKRTDFVDVEWEFVCGEIYSSEVCGKLQKWACNRDKQLTIFMSHDDDEKNLSEGMSLPREIYEKGIPVIVQQSSNSLAGMLNRSALYQNVHFFGMKDCGYDLTTPLIKLAKMLKYFYDCSYGAIGVPSALPTDKVNEAWKQETSFKMRFSSLYNVMTIATKMRSLGHAEDDADTFYALTQQEIEALAETEHNRWSVERLIQGSRPCTDQELADIRTNTKVLKKEYKKRDIHFDLRAYSELEDDGTGKNARVYDYDLTACIPLMVKTFYENIRNGE